MLKPWHSFSVEKIFKELKTQKEGLTQEEAQKRLQKFGLNKLPHEKPSSGLRLFLRQFESPLIYILLLAGLITLFIKDYVDMSVIFGVVAINTIIGFIQENKASQVLLKLKTLVRDKAIVIRENNQKEIDIQNLAPGDIIVLKPGDKAPSDGRLIEADNLKINESILTGEWLTADKRIGILDKKTPLADRDNMVFMGTVVEEGWGKAVVTATGVKTELGQIAFLTKKTKEEKTPFQKKIAHLGRVIGLVIVLISFLILIIGLLAGHPFLQMFTTSVAIAVSAIPEGLPAAMTVVLAIGMQKILKRNGLTKTLLGVETLGNTSIICTDKTGSLTEGKMKVIEIIAPKKELILKIITLSNEAFIENPEQTMDKWIIRGRPTDRALLLAALSFGLNKKELEAKAPRLEILPFTPERKYIATLHKETDNYFLYFVGAPERILEKSIYFETDRHFEKLTLGEFKKLKEKHEELTKNGLRVLAAGYKKINSQDDKIKDNMEKFCQDIVFAGFIALKDPLRPEVKETINLCKQAGLRPIIVTGDHRLTAQAIAQELDLPAKKENILEGYQLDLMEDKELQKKVEKIEIYARVDPKHKMRIIEAWQKRGEVVAMTGDGVNDAPALKKADIGVALGSGTDVAKEASDLILLNNNFSIIVAAIEEGRVILDNLKKIIVYLLSDSLSEVVLIGGSLILGLPLPLIPVQILWVNLIADSLPNMALAFEKKEKDVMKRRPQTKTALLDKKVKALILIVGGVTSLILFSLFLWLFKNTNDLTYIRTMLFVALGIDSLFYVFSCKSLERPIWRINPFSNKYLIASVFIGFIMMGLALYLPLFQTLLRTVSLGMKDWLILLAIGLLNIAAIEIVKWRFIAKKQ
ncbi:MAG: hypothetical protein A3E90_01410 [Candidatus Portnoybacteria bacterium RIFCSPHIGHO2_12_FULL_40_11]|uniref:Cation-transporting P-type ATPase N-terminal domain-containing protein n=1 Tax=Candidatus Portnoybacteria bacterium RIFCSPHIGHO2_12_FULL_40_11 TaxID=1801998 RepID=A0A1G2FKM0_9BACT|nr:MAG: hypothetical protein A3E90_01410 [Candidatus Portnoybacteria bacterium RIFCSPHIGHO2_12_FULL_40_11]